MENNEIKTCSRCLVHEQLPGVSIHVDGECNLCKKYVPYVPADPGILLKVIKKAKKKGRTYDALVPVSGGKDSAYVLYLAVRKYGLKVLTFTFDNGFMSPMAMENIGRITESCGVDHVWVRHNPSMLKKLYRTALMNSGEICGLCGMGIENSMLKISEAWKIPLIFLGHSPTEQNSFSTENIYDTTKLKAILRYKSEVTTEMIDRFLIYPDLNFITSYIYSRTGRFGRKINLLYFEQLPSDKEISKILNENLGWTESNHSGYSRHFDCLAEPFSNYIREKRMGYSRRLPQLSNMIRSGEIGREEAIDILQKDKEEYSLDNFGFILETLNLNHKDLNRIENIPLHVFEDEKSKANLLFGKVRALVKGN